MGSGMSIDLQLSFSGRRAGTLPLRRMPLRAQAHPSGEQ